MSNYNYGDRPLGPIQEQILPDGKWSRALPKKDGYYWMRTHDGQPVVCWFEAGTSLANTMGGASIKMTRDYIATQDVEFCHEQIQPPHP